MADALASLRSLTSSQYVARSASEGAAVAVVSSPVFGIFYFLDGLLVSRFPRDVPGSPAPASTLGLPPAASAAAAAAPRHTFPSLLSSASLYCLNCTVRTSLWVVFACAGSAALRESLGVGPRHQDPVQALQDPRVITSAVLAGGLSAGALTWDWAGRMGSGRYYLYMALGGIMGALLPDIFGRIGPRVKQHLARILPQKGSSSGAAELA